MEIERVRALRGPNLWSRRTAIEAIVHCNEDERDLARLPGFVKHLRAIYPQLQVLPLPDGGVPRSAANVIEIDLEPAGPGRLPGELQSLWAHARPRCVPGGSGI